MQLVLCVEPEVLPMGFAQGPFGPLKRPKLETSMNIISMRPFVGLGSTSGKRGYG